MAKRDLACFQTGEPRLQALADAGGGRFVTGAEKLAQRFVLALFTSVGSLNFRSQWGTNYPDDIQAGNVTTEFEAFAIMNQAALQAGSSLQSDEDDDTPEDEQFAKVEVDQLVISQDEVSIAVTISSVAGTTVGLVLPLRFSGNAHS